MVKPSIGIKTDVQLKNLQSCHLTNSSFKGGQVMNSNENCNVTGVSKKSLADQLYKLLDEELCDMADVCDIDEFSVFFNRVLKDYCLVPANQIIE